MRKKRKKWEEDKEKKEMRIILIIKNMSRFEFTKKEVEEYLVSISYKKCKNKEMLYFYKKKEIQKD